MKKEDKQVKKQIRKDHVWKQSFSADDIKTKAGETIKRMLTVMGMVKNIELTKFIGCHKNETAKWRKKGVPLQIVYFISAEANVTMDYLLHGTLPKYTFSPKAKTNISSLIQKSLELGGEMKLVTEQRPDGYGAIANKVTLELIEFMESPEGQSAVPTGD